MPAPMTKKKPKKAKVKKSKNKNLVLYVENCSLKGKVFSDCKDLSAWVKEFQTEHPYNEGAGDNWIDLIVTDIKGDITPVDPSMKVG